MRLTKWVYEKFISFPHSFLSYHFSLFGQPYFPVDSAKWETAHVSSCCFQGIIVHKWNENLSGDTLLQNELYSKLIFQPECTHITAGLNCSESYYYPSGGPYTIGAIREENGKIFFQKFDVHSNLFSSYETALANVPPLIDLELYDFNWALTDTIIYPVIAGESQKFKVILIDIQNGRKRIALQHKNGTGYIIEVFEGMGE